MPLAGDASPGGGRPGGPGTIVFCHANSFPAGTYRLLFEHWRAKGWRVAALPLFGHDPAYPVSSNWPRIRHQLLDFMRSEAAQGPAPLVLVGHSLGGYLSLLAASRQPGLARALVLLDSPVLGGWRARSVQLLKRMGLIARVSPAKVSHKRRWQWPSAEAAWQHFAAKRSFARWHPEVLRDYISCGTEPDPNAQPAAGLTDDGTKPVRLVFSREVETRLYNTLPHHMGALLARHPVGAPVAFIGGTQSVENRQVGLALTRALTHGRLHFIEGSHLFPMEKPLETAQAVLDQIDPLLTA